MACIVRWVDEDTIHFASVERQKSLERVQIIPVHDQVAVQRNRAKPPAPETIIPMDQRPVMH